MSTLSEDIPFVARLNTAQADQGASAGAESQTSGQGFSLFQRKDDSGDDGGAQKKQASNPFKGLFQKKDRAAEDKTETASRNGGLGLFGAGKSDADIAVQQNAESVIISNLQVRRSIIPAGSSYDSVASAVLAANSRAAEAELRAARLRAVAASKNWLPSIGPSISLSSLGELVANLIVEQVLFDNGRKKAERAFAAADVEVAAVTLSQDTNMRVFTALDLYLKSQEATEKSRLSTTAFNDMSHFEYIMTERVRGGVSDRSDLVVLRQKLAEIRSDMASNSEASTTALAELNAMSVRDLSGVSGLSDFNVNGLSSKPLPILLAEAEKERAVAAATMERASNLPGLKAVGSTGTSGNQVGLQVASDQLFGFGTGATLKAIEATKDGAQRKVGQAREDSDRRLRSLEAELRGVQRQSKEASALSSQSKKNLDLFQAQYKAGTRQVMDVVGVYQTYARQQSSAATLKYRAARIKLEIAREMGLLASGRDI
ncbi:MAG: TolC family protein [Pseudomonadota bacterium]